MVRAGVGASWRLRWGIVALSSALTVVAIGSNPAEARRRHHHRSAYHPPYAHIVVDANTGQVLDAKNPDALRHPASLTKIMTLYLLFEQLDAGKIKLDDELKVSAHAAAQAPTKLGLKPGSTITVETAIKGLVTRSANDAAVAIAENLAGSEEAFARQMTRKAKALGMSRTVYDNASGLPDDEQVTTARDQALLGRAIQDRFPRYYRYFSISSFRYKGVTIRNHNHLLGRVKGVDGIKTGYTRSSGFNLISSVRRGPRHLVAVVLGGTSARWRDARMKTLIADYIDDASTRRTVAKIGVPAEKSEEEPAREVAAAMPRPAPARESAPMVLSVNEPLRPVPVKTLSVRASTPKGTPLAQIAAATAAAPAQGQAYTLAGTSTKVASADNATGSTAAAEPHRSGWMIQVGALPSEEEARERLKETKNVAKRLLRSADPFTEAVEKGERTLYRARFAGLDPDDAVAACKVLKRNRIDCIAIKN